MRIVEHLEDLLVPLGLKVDDGLLGSILVVLMEALHQ